MRYAVLTLVAVILTLTSCSGELAASSPLKSGLQPGEAIPGPFHYLNVNGPHAGKPHCLVCEFGLRPTVLIFVRDLPADKSPLMDLFQKLDEAVSRYKNAELRVGVIVLSEEFTKEGARKELIRKLESVGKELKQIPIAVDGATGPEGYKINKDAAVAVIVYARHRVVDNFAFAKDKLTEKDVAAILGAVTKMVAAK
jgi:hypothetical protein